MAQVLVVDSDAVSRQVLLDQVRRAGHAPVAVPYVQSSTDESPGVSFDVVLVRARRHERARTVVSAVKAAWPKGEVIVIGQEGDLDDATDAVRHGAYDYLKVATVRNTLADALQGALERQGHGEPLRASGDVAESLPTDPASRAVFEQAERMAAVNSTVLITGESGTGKEVLARRMHRFSERRRFKFVPINCGSLPETLIETELFGYRKGAFTGALADSKGLFEDAEGGTLFLDEIGEMPLAMQVKLLRFLDCGEVRRVGSTAIKHVDVRVIAATNRCLQSEMREKRFREDLYYRLSVVPLHLPPMRERRGDIPALVQHCLARVAARLNLSVPAIAPETMDRLIDYDWPGNVRELQNAVEYALLQADRTIRPEHLPGQVTSRPLAFSLGAFPPVEGETEAERVRTALTQHNGSLSRTATALGISRTTLWRRLKPLKAQVAQVASSVVLSAPSDQLR